MAIRVEHQAAPGIQGLAAFAGGRGKARQRQRTELLSFYRDEANRRERRQSQLRSFTYQGALEGMRQGATERRRIEDREFATEDDARDRQRAIEDREAREAHDGARDDRRWKGYADRAAADRAREEDERQRERERDEEIRQGIMSGEMVFSDPKAQAEWDKAQAARTCAILNMDFDDEQRQDILSQIDATERRLLPLAQPRPSDDDFEQTTKVIDGIRYGKGDWKKLADEGADARKQRDQDTADLKKMMGTADDSPDAEPGALKYDTTPQGYADAMAEVRRQREYSDYGIGLPGYGRTAPEKIPARTQGVPRRPEETGPPQSSPTAPDGQQGGGQREVYDPETGGISAPPAMTGQDEPPAQPLPMEMAPLAPPPGGSYSDLPQFGGQGAAQAPQGVQGPQGQQPGPGSSPSGASDPNVIAPPGSISPARRRRGESEASASQRGDAQQVIRDLKQKVRNGGKLTPEEVATLSQLRESLKRRNR